MSTQKPGGRTIPVALRWLAVPVIVAGLAFAWWTVSPLFLNTQVDEAFPTAAPAAGAASAMPAAAEPTTAPTGAAAPTTLPPTEPTPAVPPTAAPPTAVPPTAAPAAPVALSNGSFTFIDNLHWAEGSATIYRLPDGSHVLRLEPFQAQNGPDLFVGLSGHAMPRSSAEAHDSGYVELARLKANQGNQNYELPADLDLSAFKSVVIYCKAFSVVFSTAELMSQG